MKIIYIFLNKNAVQFLYNVVQYKTMDKIIYSLSKKLNVEESRIRLSATVALSFVIFLSLVFLITKKDPPVDGRQYDLEENFIDYNL